MSEDDVTDGAQPTQPDAARDPGPARSTNAAAAAASRARRIGGRAVGTGAPAQRPSADAPDEAEPVTGDPVTGDPVSEEPVTDEPVSDEPVADEPTTDEPVTERSAAPAGRLRKRVGKAEQGAAADASSGASRASTATRQGSRAVWWPAAVLSAGVVAVLVVVLVTALGGRSGSGQARRDQVLAAAKSCVAATNTYSYKDLSGFERKGLACGTGTFAVKFKDSVDNILKKIAPTVKQEQTFQVNAAGIVSVSGGTWTILIYGQTKAVNVAHTDGETDPYAAIATMVDRGGRWRLSTLNTLCSAGLSASGNQCV